MILSGAPAMSSRMDAFVAGEPVLFLTNPARESTWSAQVRAAIATSLEHPRLGFIVASLTRGHQPFDIDNLAKLVLDAVAPDPASVWVTVEVGDRPGVRIGDEAPPSLDASLVDVRIGTPPRRSVRSPPVLVELATAVVIEPATAPIGLELTYDSAAVRIGRFDFEGPVKPLIDALAPLFGRYANGPADHRVRELRITKGVRPGEEGVRVRAWRL